MSAVPSWVDLGFPSATIGSTIDRRWIRTSRLCVVNGLGFVARLRYIVHEASPGRVRSTVAKRSASSMAPALCNAPITW